MREGDEAGCKVWPLFNNRQTVNPHHEMLASDISQC
jgi:hypothetical protein